MISLHKKILLGVDKDDLDVLVSALTAWHGPYGETSLCDLNALERENHHTKCKDCDKMIDTITGLLYDITYDYQGSESSPTTHGGKTHGTY